MTAVHVLPLATADASLEKVGGKGRSLARMATAGLPVPHRFHLTTSVYRRFVEENNMQATILELARPSINQMTVSFEPASASIQALFEEAELPTEIITKIRQAYGALSENDRGYMDAAVPPGKGPGHAHWRHSYARIHCRQRIRHPGRVGHGQHYPADCQRATNYG